MKCSLKISTLVALLGLLAVSCSGSLEVGDPSSIEESPVESSSPSGMAGVLEGRVLYEGPDVPRATVVQNTTNPGECEPTQSLRDILISSETAGIQNVVISLGNLNLPEVPGPPPSELVLDNRKCQFEPHVAVLTSGSELRTINSDAISHSVHVYGPFDLNVAVGPGQSKAVRRLERPGYYIVKCDIHTWMQAYLRVDRHSFHAVSGRDGSFRIENIPAGSHSVEVWHEVFGKQTIETEIRPGKTTKVTVHFPE